MHVHASALDALVVIAYVVIAWFIMRSLATRYPDSPFAQAVIFITG